MRQKQEAKPGSAEKMVRDLRRATRRRHASEEKIRIVLEGLRHRRRAWRCEKADGSYVSFRGYSSSCLPFWPTQCQLPTDLNRRV